MRLRRFGATLTLLGLLLSGTPVAPAADAVWVPVRLEPGGHAKAGVEASWVERYGAFDWAEIQEQDLDRLAAAGVAFEAHPEVRTLALPSVSFDPLVDVPAGIGFEGETGPALRIVQFRSPTRDAWLSALHARGVRLVQPIAPFGYVVVADAASTSELGSLPFVRWAGSFDPAYRFGHLGSTVTEGPVNVVLIEGASLGASVRMISRLTEELRVTGSVPFMEVEGVGVQLELGASDLGDLMRLPAVYSISAQRRPMPRDELSDQIVATLGTPRGAPQPGYQASLGRYAVTGDGVIVAHVDSGVDGTHPDLLRRIRGCKDYVAGGALCVGTGVPGSNDMIFGQSDTLGHGTHTAGIIVATGTVPATDASGFRYGQGVAPGAKLYVQNYVSLAAPFGPTGPGQYIALNRDSVLGGATVSANSWGPAGTPQGYDADTREFDFAPRDANLETSQHEPLDFVLSIMNGSGGTSTQGSPDEGKNLLRVGGTKNLRVADSGADELCTCSAHGPDLDGRRLVDVVAPGQAVISTKSSTAVPIVCGIPPTDPDGVLHASCTYPVPPPSSSSTTGTAWAPHRARRSSGA